MRTVIDTHEDADGVFRPKRDGLAGALDDLEDLAETANGFADQIDEGVDRLSRIMERRKFLRPRQRRAPIVAEKVTDE